MRFIIDADLPRSLKKTIESHNHECFDVRDLGLHTDEEILEYAKKNELIVVTRDLGFGNMVEYPIKENIGLIIFRLPYHFTSAKITSILNEFLKSIDTKLLIKSLIVIELERYRIRKY
ncbi:MAG: DUF5615 family PIN-like protein [Candidatus Aenigmarchaeota archaeon]|nr:DUF5615 family PIN-like protein [Candidatus Aenigmarchaeota archaeon]